MPKHVCPLCQTPLSETRFAQVMRAHRGMKQQLERLRAAERHTKEALAKAKAEAKSIRERARWQARQALEKEKRRNKDWQLKYESQLSAMKGKMEQLQDRLNRGETAQSEGLLEEKKLLAFLEGAFTDDRFVHTGRGGDILQEVCTARGTCAGKIVYEIKRTSQWAEAHLEQCAEAKVTRAADIAILVTNRFPAKEPHFFVRRDVLVISPLGLLAVVHTARERLLDVHQLQASGTAKQKAVRALYDYLGGGAYKRQVQQIAQHLTDLERLFAKEQRDHQRMWTDRVRHYRGLVTGFGTVHDTLTGHMAPAVEGAGSGMEKARKLLPAFRAEERVVG